MHDDPKENNDDAFGEFDEWLAAQVRQYFSAVNAADSKAVEVCLFYLEGHLVKTLGRHLWKDPRWDSRECWLDGLSAVTIETNRPGHLRLRAVLTWADKEQRHWYDEPFAFEIELSPVSGAFENSSFRFGDHRPLAEKMLPSCSTVMPDRAAGANDCALAYRRKK